MLLNEFQKQQRTIDAQNKRLAQLEREMAALRKRSAN
jgi:type II secretory pathway component PulJ